MSRYFRVYQLAVRNSLIREMNFKVNFLLWVLVDLLWFLGQLALIEVLYGQVDAIAGWTKWQVVALVGAHQVVSQLFMALFYLNLTNLPELIRTGRLDLLLTLPIDAQFAVSTRQISLDSLVNALVGIGIITFALWKLGHTPGPWEIALAAFAILLGIAIHYAVLFALACVSFWSIKAQGFIHGYFNLFHIGRYPERVFRGAFRFLFTWLVPVIWVSNAPAMLLARPMDSPWLALLALITGAILVTVATRLLWRFALRHYGSASS